MWRDDFDALRLGEGALADGAQVVVARRAGLLRRQPHVVAVVLLRDHARCASPARATCSRSSTGCARRSTPRACSRRRSGCARPALPRTIGVVTGEGGKARDDVLAGLRRRGWQGRLVWAFAPVQDRHAAPRITAALQDLAATGAVDVIVVARGGGSLADLFCFCDETLCRTIALLGVPVIASVGHHTDRTLIDDVAALSCSTPTHAAESAVPVHCREARAGVLAVARRLDVHGRRALLHRAQTLARLSRAPGEHLAGERRRLHQRMREIRAAGPPARADRARRAPPARRSCSTARRTRRRSTPAARRSLSALALALDGARPRAHARARLRARHRSGRRARHERGGRARAPATCGCASATPRSMRRSRATMTEPEPIPLTAEPLTYEAATARLEEIIKRLDSGEAGLRETLELCREGRTLVELCAAELEAVGQGLEELQLGELVARLEAGAGAQGG